MENPARLLRIIISGSEPLGESNNAFVYATGSTVTLHCNTANVPGSYLPNNYAYRWMTDCNDCFPYGGMTQSVSVEPVTLCDAGTFNCSASIGDQIYTSENFTLHVYCEW